MNKNKWKLINTKGKQPSKKEVIALFDKSDYFVNSISTKEEFESRVNDDGTIMLYNTEWHGFKSCYGYEPKLIKDNNK